LYVLTSERERLFQDPFFLFKIWEGGLVFYGGLIASVLVAIWFLKKYRISFWKYADFFAPALALGHAIGRQGCFLAGCCYGRPLLVSAWFSVTFPTNINSLAPAGIPLYSTQLMESLGEFLIFLGLAWGLRRKKFDGQIFILYLMIYAGFLWMTARGAEEQVKKSQDIIIAAVIGLVITLSAYAISALITGKFSKGVDDPQVGTDVVNSIAETLRSTPGTLSHYMAEAEEWEAAWGAMDDEEE